MLILKVFSDLTDSMIVYNAEYHFSSSWISYLKSSADKNSFIVVLHCHLSYWSRSENILMLHVLWQFVTYLPKAS